MATIKSLISIDENEPIIWNPEYGHLEIGQDENKQTLLLTSRPYFTVKDVRLSPIKNLVALSGDKGVTIVELPRKWGSRFKNSKDNQIYCKTYNLNERLFSCEKRLRVQHALWHPFASEARQTICVLTNDNRLRFYDVIENEEVQVINLTLKNEDDDEDDLCLGMSMLNLGESGICFDFGPPLVAQEPETLWPIYILMGTGDVLLIYSSPNNPTYAEHIIGPLTMFPQAEDNYGSDACSLITLNSSPPLIAIATPNGSIYHCFAFVDKSTQILPKQTLYVYESIELSKDLIENPDDPYSPHPIRLFKDPTSDIRYFCVHENGVHTVVLPILESIQAQCDIDHDKESFSEFLLCTRTTSPTDANQSCDDTSTPRGIGVEIRQTSIVLLVLMPDGEMISQRISPATALINRRRFPRPALDSSRTSADHDILNISQVDATSTNFEEQIQQILKRSTNIPMLKLSDNLEQQKNIGELIDRMTTIFKGEYIRRYELAIEAIKKKLGILERDLKNQKVECGKIMDEKNEVYMSIIALRSKADMACEKQKELLARIDKVIVAVTHGQPELNQSEGKLRRELKAMDEKIKFYRDQLDSIINKYKYHASQKDPTSRYNKDLTLSQSQLSALRETLSRQGSEISELKRMVKLQLQQKQ